MLPMTSHRCNLKVSTLVQSRWDGALLTLKRVLSKYNKDLIFIWKLIFGEFNLPKIDWSIPLSKGGACHEAFWNFCIQNSLVQKILASTHTSGHTLDLLFCNLNSSCYLTTWNTLPPLSSTCDHCMISFNIITDPMQSKNNLFIPNYKRANYDIICSKLSSVDWTNLIAASNNDVQQLYINILNELSQIIANYVPVYKKKRKTKQPHHLKNVLKQKKFHYKQLN